MQIPKGYKLVPAEPTEEMLYAASWVHGPGGFGEVKRRIGLEYRAAISAAPVIQCEIRLPEKYDESQYRGTSLLAVRRWNQCIDEVLRLNSMTASAPPQPIHDEAKERELFEAWADEKGFCLDCEFFKKGNNYIDQATGRLYESWIARAKAGEVGHE